jgi:hypothetical protein
VNVLLCRKPLAAPAEPELGRSEISGKVSSQELKLDIADRGFLQSIPDTFSLFVNKPA